MCAIPSTGNRLPEACSSCLRTIGSSSASAVLMELVHNGQAPAALVLHEPDAILLLGLIVAKEMGWKTPVAVKLDGSRFAGFAGGEVSVSAGGLLRLRTG